MIYLPYSAIGEILQVTSSPLTGRESAYTELLPDAVGTLSTESTEISDATYRVDVSATPPALVTKTAIPAPTTLSTQVNSVVSITGLPESSVLVSGDAAALDNTQASGYVGLSGLEDIAITDGEVDFTTDLAGEYTLVFSSPLYLDTTTVITVTD